METENITAYIGLGSNIENRAGNLLLAVRGLMEASLHIHRLSAIYETEPFGVDNQNNFLNMVAEVRLSSISPEQVMARMLRIEYLLGRRDKFLQLPRTVDLDLLFYGNLQHHTEFLTLPHPRLHERKFVLIPMAEIAPNFPHPVLHKSIRELLTELKDETKVRRWNPQAKIESGNLTKPVFTHLH